MTTTLGAITPGKWTVEHKDGYFPSVRIPTSTGGTDKLTINAGFWESKVHLANAKLIADAGNTANKTGKLPSQLKQDVDELVKELENILEWHRIETTPLREQELKSIADLISRITN